MNMPWLQLNVRLYIADMLHLAADTASVNNKVLRYEDKVTVGRIPGAATVAIQ